MATRKRSSTRSASRRVALAIATLAALAGATQVLASSSGHDWPMIGHDPANTRNQPFEHKIKPSNVSRLAPKWVATTTGDVSATPAVVKGAVYFGDFGGTLWKLDADTGATIWSHSVPDYTGFAGDYARTSPSVIGRTLVVGIIKGSPNAGPNMLGIDTRTGALRWKTQIHADPRAAMTGSPTLVGNMVITGVSANGAGGATSTFRGAIVALDAQTGEILWRTYSVPDNGGVPTGYAGATMFSPPAVDVSLGLVYGTFGQAYRKPASVDACNAAAPGGFSESCEQPGAYWKSIVAFDLKTGAPQWSYRVFGHEPWQRACGDRPPQVKGCAPETDGENWDLGGSGANVFRLKINHHWRDVVGVGEKSGVYIVLDAETGAFIWNSLVGPGGDQGGMNWGTAYDGDRIYVSITNQHNVPYQLTQGGVTSGPFVTGGSWAALDPATGTILWQVGDPVGAYDLAPVTSANGVVYASSMPQTGDQMFALDGETGEILWRYAAGSSVNSGPSVVDGTVYWGSGYDRRLGGNGNNKLFAFSIDGKRDKHDEGGDDG
jgi:polyvinyl alcohol dehydrogenase (cytochrome)